MNRKAVQLGNQTKQIGSCELQKREHTTFNLLDLKPYLQMSLIERNLHLKSVFKYVPKPFCSRVSALVSFAMGISTFTQKTSLSEVSPGMEIFEKTQTRWLKKLKPIVNLSSTSQTLSPKHILRIQGFLKSPLLHPNVALSAVLQLGRYGTTSSVALFQ